jgi:predicted nucleotidyltransferase component of viral defense system
MSQAMQLKARVKNLAAKYHVPAQAVLQNFMLERLLERIAHSPYRDVIVLKGGMLIGSMVGIGSRTTMDMDTTLRGYPLAEDALGVALTEICAISLEDGVTFRLDHITPIRDDDEYGGYRAAVIAMYGTIHTPLKIDMTTGDAITPGAIRYVFPSSFEEKGIEVWAYPIETILAEKVETILRRSVLNTRPRDFYDVYTLVRTQADTIRPDVFVAALQATCEKRTSQVVLQNKADILQNIRADAVMRQRWERYGKEYFYARDIPFDDVLDLLTELLSEGFTE